MCPTMMKRGAQRNPAASQRARRQVEHRCRGARCGGFRVRRLVTPVICSSHARRRKTFSVRRYGVRRECVISSRCGVAGVVMPMCIATALQRHIGSSFVLRLRRRCSSTLARTHTAQPAVHTAATDDLYTFAHSHAHTRPRRRRSRQAVLRRFGLGAAGPGSSPFHCRFLSGFACGQMSNIMSGISSISTTMRHQYVIMLGAVVICAHCLCFTLHVYQYSVIIMFIRDSIYRACNLLQLKRIPVFNLIENLLPLLTCICLYYF